LFRHHRNSLRQWARRHLPGWARSLHDTSDIVQDVLLQTFRRIDKFENRGRGALRAYLQMAIRNHVIGQVRKAVRHPSQALDDGHVEPASQAPSPEHLAAEAEAGRHFKQALTMLSDDERTLVVGRLELNYSYEQLALVTGRATAGAARIAVRRAVAKLATRMADGTGG
jgi:RNA polymerase sigma factor (sigma-70 family)